MKLYGLIGFPLGHSFSRRYFTEKFDREGIADCEYRNFPIESIEEVSRLLSRPELQGFNVTIPYKQQIIPYLSALSDEARAIGAVNCVRLGPDGPVGYNTDAFGFRRSLLSLLGGADRSGRSCSEPAEPRRRSVMCSESSAFRSTACRATATSAVSRTEP